MLRIGKPADQRLCLDALSKRAHCRLCVRLVLEFVEVEQRSDRFTALVPGLDPLQFFLEPRGVLARRGAPSDVDNSHEDIARVYLWVDSVLCTTEPGKHMLVA